MATDQSQTDLPASLWHLLKLKWIWMKLIFIEISFIFCCCFCGCCYRFGYFDQIEHEKRKQKPLCLCDHCINVVWRIFYPIGPLNCRQYHGGGSIVSKWKLWRCKKQTSIHIHPLNFGHLRSAHNARACPLQPSQTISHSHYKTDNLYIECKQHSFSYAKHMNTFMLN